MYRIKDEYGNIIDELVNPQWLKQQKRVDRPICANSYEEADGVVLSDGETMRGIAGRGMENYTPLVTVEEVSGEPYIFRDLDTVKQQGADASTQLDAQQSLQLASMQGQADQYTTTLAMQEQINAQQQLILANMQGLADVYTTLLSMQTPTGTEA